MSNRFWLGGENDGGGGRENDGGGRAAGPFGPEPFNPGPLPGWDSIFDGDWHAVVFGARFPEDGWDPAMEIDRIALAFSCRDWKTKADPGPPPGHFEPGASDEQKAAAEKALMEDVKELLLLKEENFDEGEIIYQANDILSYFMKLGSCSAQVRPITYFLLVLSLRVGQIVARYYKGRYMRARPVQVVPSLDTVIATPRHPSYPSGHALQARLMAKVLTEVASALGAQARTLANNITLNRERAGVHFRSDSAASEKIADKIWKVLTNMKEFNDKIQKARKTEYSGVVSKLPKAVTDEILKFREDAQAAAQRA